MKTVAVKATKSFISPVHGNVREGDRLQVSEAFAAHLEQHKQAERIAAPDVDVLEAAPAKRRSKKSTKAEQ